MLQASCHWISAQRDSDQDSATQGMLAQYLPLDELQDYSPQDLLENLEQLPLTCLDNIQVIAGNPEWEQALFDLYNRVRQAGTCLLVGANQAPRELPLALLDLQSRFGWGPVFQLPVPDDEEKIAILQFRAARRGMSLNDEVASYLINRSGRGMAELMGCLDRLEEVSLQEGRKLSVPFVKQVFNF